MRLPFRRKAITGSPEILESLQERTAAVFSVLGGDNQANARIKAAFARAQSAGYAWMYENSPAVRMVVDLITRNVSQLDLRLYEEVDDVTRELRPNHPAALSLRFPSPTQTRDQFVRCMVQDYLVFQNAYALKFRNPGSGRIMFKHIPAHRVEVFGMGLFDPDAYRVWRLDGSPMDVPNPQDMVHWRGYNPMDQRIGLSPLETLRNVIAEDAALQAAITELMKAGLMGPGYVFRPDTAAEWSNEARKGFEEDLTNRLKKVNTTPPVFEEGMEFRPMGVSPRDAQMLDVRKWALEQVCGLYGVPVEMLGLGVGRGADLKAAQSEFYADTLPPICESFTNQLGLSVLQDEYGVENFLFAFDLDAKHMGDERLTALVSATGGPILTRDEGRAMINKPPVDGGDQLITPLNVIVGSNPKPSPAAMPIQDPNGPPQDGSHRLPPGKAEPIARFHPQRSADMQRQRGYVQEAKAVMGKFYARQARSLRKKSTFNPGLWNRELTAELQGLMSSIVEREGNLYSSKLAGDGFDMNQVKNYLATTAENIAESINATTETDIETLGLDEAMNQAQTMRADTAGTSIGARTTIFARVEAAKQTPDADRRMKVWLADSDRHAEFDGTAVPIGDEWPAGFGPGSAPGCACSAAVI